MSATITPKGEVGYRTRLLPQRAAETFARCIGANPQYQNAEVRESPQARGERRWWVFWRPAADRRADAIRQQAQAERADRAAAEAAGYIWVLDDTRRFWHLWNPATGGQYQVALRGETCDCPDYQIRGRAGLRCKHLIAFTLGRQAGSWNDGMETIPEPEAAKTPPGPPCRLCNCRPAEDPETGLCADCYADAVSEADWEGR